MMLRAGKNVLVEKPTAITYQEAKLMYDEAEVNTIMHYLNRCIS